MQRDTEEGNTKRHRRGKYKETQKRVIQRDTEEGNTK